MNIQKKIIKVLSGNIPLVSRPYKTMAESIGMSENNFMKKIKLLIKKKQLKGIRAVPKHQNIGYKTNVMAVWKIEEKDIVRKAKKVVKIRNVSHCYQRKKYPDWDFNLYTMIHAKNKTDCFRIVKKIKNIITPVDYKLLFSEKEYKKTSFAM